MLLLECVALQEVDQGTKVLLDDGLIKRKVPHLSYIKGVIQRKKSQNSEKHTSTLGEQGCSWHAQPKAKICPAYPKQCTVLELDLLRVDTANLTWTLSWPSQVGVRSPFLKANWPSPIELDWVTKWCTSANYIKGFFASFIGPRKLLSWVTRDLNDSTLTRGRLSHPEFEFFKPGNSVHLVSWRSSVNTSTSGYLGLTYGVQMSSSKPCLNYVEVRYMNSVFPFRSILNQILR